MRFFNKNMIAPCGMNCGVCSAFLREKDKCPGCNNNPTLGYCQKCSLRLCDKRKGAFCDCGEYCDRLKKLDKRYREKYGMSEIENIEFIREHGIEKFLEKEETKYISDKGIFCVHNKKYYKG